MISSRRIILLIICAIFAQVSFGQPKVIERSSRKVPQWFGGTQSGYIITSASNADLEIAKRQCMANVRREIIESVAQNITATAQMSVNQSTTNDGIVKYLERFASQSETQAATLPFLNGISSTKVTDFYWQKVYDKKTEKSYYDYSIQYPFSKSELHLLISQFEHYDNKMVGQMETLTNELTQISSIAQIESAILELDNLVEYFFDPVRRNQAANLQQRYGKCYDNITFEILNCQLGIARYRLLYDGHPIIVSQRPIVRSKCASQIEINFSSVDDCWTLTYHYDGCLESEENSIEVIYRFGSKVVKSDIFFDISAK